MSVYLECRGLWIEGVILVSGCCTLPGTMDGDHLSLNLSRVGSKRHTPGTRFGRRAKPREEVMLTHHRAHDLHNAGNRPRRMKFPQELNDNMFKTKMSHLDGGLRLWSCMERDRLRHATLPKKCYMKMTTTSQSIPFVCFFLSFFLPPPLFFLIDKIRPGKRVTIPKSPAVGADALPLCHRGRVVV